MPYDPNFMGPQQTDFYSDVQAPYQYVDTEAPDLSVDPSVQAYLDSIVKANNPQMILPQPKLQGQLQAGDMLSGIVGGSQKSGQPGQGMADLGSVLGGMAGWEQGNRQLQGQFTQNYDRLMMDAQQGRNATESDAMKKLAQTNYILGGGSKFDPSSLQYHYGTGPQPTSDAQKQGAQTLQDQLVKRLAPGGTYTPQPLNDYAKPGTTEQIGKWGGYGTSILGSILGNQGQEGGGDLGKVIGGIEKYGKPIVTGIEKAGKWLGGLF